MKQRVATVMLGAFLAADVVLVAMALRSPSPGSPPSVGINSHVTTPASTGRPSGTGTAARPTTKPTTGAPRPTGAPAGFSAQPLLVTLTAFDATTAWRSTVGSCNKGGATVEVSTDGGATWATVTAPAGAVVRVQPLGAARAFAVAAGDECALAQFTTNDAGETWAGPQALEGGWARRLDQPNEVVTPQLENARPCGDVAVIDLSRTSAEQAEALCAGGAVKVTDDGGQTWADSGEAEGGLALSNRLEADVLSTYVARVASGCSGVEVVKVVKGEQASQVACVDTRAATRGRIAISVTTDSGWLRVGDETWTADAQLKTWNQA